MGKALLREFIEYSNMEPSLVRAVVRQSGGWESFQEMALDIVQHGINCGFSGWIYYTETTKFFKNNRKLILKLAEEQAYDFGVQSVIDFIYRFNWACDRPTYDEIAKAIYTGKGEICTHIENMCAWYAVESVADRFYMMCDEN